MKKLTEQEVVELLKSKQGETGLSANKFAREVLGVTPPYLSEVYHGTRRPGELILAYLGLERHEETICYYLPASKTVVKGKKK